MEWYVAAGGLQEIPFDLYNCDRLNVSDSQWYSLGKPDFLSGILCLTYGIIIEILYIPCLMVISRVEYMKYSCYKIMLILGMFDMMAIVVNSILTGYFMLHGAVFCTNPHLIYITGSIGLGLWCGACLTCLLLVVNRIIDLWKPHLMELWFGGSKTYYIMLIPLAYCMYFILWTPPLLFNSKRKAWFFDPFLFDAKDLQTATNDAVLSLTEDPRYMNFPHTANNLLIVVLTCLLYGFLCVVLVQKFNVELGSEITWAQKSIFIQSSLICLANLVAALVYVYMQFFPVADWLVVVGHISWQFGHGFPAIVYLAINRTIQTEVLKLIGLRKNVRHHSPFTTKIGSSQTNPSTFHI